MFVKICGIKNLQDAKISLNNGADQIGLLVGQKHSSSDFLSNEDAAGLIKNLNAPHKSTIVTHLESAAEVLKLLDQCSPGNVQLHSSMTPEEISQIRNHYPNIKIAKAFHVNETLSITDIQRYYGLIDYVLLDTANASTNQVGGTGITHDWAISKKIREQCSLPVIIAGGLTPDNVCQAIQVVKPFGVDVNSGVKERINTGEKSASKIASFICIAKNFNDS